MVPGFKSVVGYEEVEADDGGLGKRKEEEEENDGDVDVDDTGSSHSASKNMVVALWFGKLWIVNPILGLGD